VPELPEVEEYRALAERCALHRAIVAVEAPDTWYLKRGLDPAGVAVALVGRDLMAARRRGKLLLLDAGYPGSGPDTVLGVRFGMTGRLMVDGVAGVDRLLYTAASPEVRHDRFAVRFADGGSMVVRDPRRLGGIELDPDEGRLGPDALTATLGELRRALAGAQVALKARLLDQSHLAGVGNLMADEILWRAGLAPTRLAASLSDQEIRRLHKHLRTGIAELIRRGGSHTGDLQPERHPGGRCPRDHTALVRATIGGRTTWWCPHHQV
jgi:formamidopyrimidine-DNA glycosylase